LSSKILVDELAGKTAAGNITITSEGGSATQSLQNGLAKMWINFNASSGTPTERDSINISSITDYSTGRFAPVLTNAMTDTNYSLTGNTNAGTGDSFAAPNTLALGCNNVITTTTTTFEASNYGTTYVDAKYIYIQVFGDLA